MRVRVRTCTCAWACVCSPHGAKRIMHTHKYPHDAYTANTGNAVYLYRGYIAFHSKSCYISACE